MGTHWRRSVYLTPIDVEMLLVAIEDVIDRDPDPTLAAHLIRTKAKLLKQRKR